MDRDEKIDSLTNHLLAAHEDHRKSREDIREAHRDNERIVDGIESLIKKISEANKEAYDIRMNLVSFEAEARLLVNDRIGEMSVERLAEVIPRAKVDQIRAYQYAREKGIAVPADPATLREPTQPVAVHAREEREDERRDPWYSRAWQATLRAPPTTLLVLVLLCLVAAGAMVVGIKLLSALDHSHLLPAPGQEHSGLK